MTPHELKARLSEVRAAHYSTRTVDVSAITDGMLAQIGNTDPELRDDLIYSTFAQWMGAAWNAGEMRAILRRLLDDEHRRFHIGERGTDSVFTRSFSLLPMALLIYHHRQSAFLDATVIRDVLDRVLQYAVEEQDLRGHTGTSGWAHSIAHLADLLDELALCEEPGARELRQILDVIRSTMTTGATHYHHDEDERMASATLSLFGRALLTDEEIRGWFSGLNSGVSPRKSWHEVTHNQRSNLKHYLRSLYFQAVKKDVPEGLRAAVAAAEREVASFP